MPVRQFVKYTFLKVDPAWRRLDDERRATDKREFTAACEDFADGHLLRCLLADRHARRRRPDAAQPGPESRADPRVSRRSRAERLDEVVHGPVLDPRDDQALGVLRRVSARGSTRARQIPVRLSVRQDARLVPPAGRRALADHAGAHQDRPRVPVGRPQHELFVRARRPGVRGRLRDRQPGRLPRSRAAAADQRVELLHAPRHADLHLHLVLGRARARGARRRLDVAAGERRVAQTTRRPRRRSSRPCPSCTPPTRCSPG